jgi:alcohol dehydrogenase class IV
MRLHFSMTLTGNWNYPTSVKLGAGRIAELPQHVAAAGVKRPLFVTDPGLADVAMTQNAFASLNNAALFSAIKPNPTGANIDAGVAAYRAGGHDGVVAFGGGSALDAGKAIAFAAGQTRPLWDFEDIGDYWTRADAAAIAPVIAVPTTAGTGSEVGRASVITHEETQTKKVIFHPRMMPVVALCDPALTAGMPPWLTAGTGMDALAHCLEAFCGTAYHPLADGIALEGMRLVKDNLPRAFAQGADLEARAQMMAAAAMGATAFQKALGAIHALSHPVGVLHNTHHGMTNAVFMPYVLLFNRSAVEEKLGRAAAYLGLKPTFVGFFDWVLALRAQLNVPHTLAAFGVDARHAGRIAAMAPLDPTASGNPVPLNAAGAWKIFEAAMEGRL